ncbi:MAG TPA: STAS domain-containing protein [Thermoleophilaceae bacterium]|nr:STAS domain-containing protein [Thermoleophilaceae bacterium]
MAEMATAVVERNDGMQVVRLAGEVDMSNAARLEMDISDVAPNDDPGLVLDLSETEYLDSAGIRMLFELAERLGGRRQTLVLVVPPDSLVRHSLEVTEVDQAIAMRHTVGEAIEAIRTG